MAILWRMAFVPALVMISLGLWQGCVPVGQQGAVSAAGATYVREKTLRLEDFVYEPQIRSVQLFPQITGAPNEAFEYPIIGLGAGRVLRCEFDELGSQLYNYYYRVIPCTWDWKPSILQDMEIVEGFNEFIVEERDLSNGTRVPYAHYVFKVPPTKLSGNYVVAVYRNGNRDDVVLTRRFCVYEPLTTINAQASFAAGVEKRFSYQQVAFTINYANYPIFNPLQTVHTILRQNGRWDNAIVNLPPLFIREEDKVLDYGYFSLENAFPGGNEWRTFDIRSMRYRGFGVAAFTYDNQRADAQLGLDVSRNVRNYTQFVDQNGRFAIAKAENPGDELSADYVNTIFTLRTPPDMPAGEVYLFGQLTDYRLSPAYRLLPDSASNGAVRRLSLPLKQGLYSYLYAIQPATPQAVPDYTSLEGSYSQTENFYDVLMYYRPIGARYDQLAGYTRINYQGRR